MRRSRLSYFKVSVTLYESVCVWVRMFVIAWCDCVHACMCLFVYVHLCDWEGGGGGGLMTKMIIWCAMHYGGEQRLTLVCVATPPHTIARQSPLTDVASHSHLRSQPGPLLSLPPRRHDPAHLTPFRNSNVIYPSPAPKCLRPSFAAPPRATHLRSSVVRPMLRSSDGASAVAASALSWF